MNAENEDSFLQKDSAEHKEYVGAQSIGNQEITEADGADLLERILRTRVQNLMKLGMPKWQSYRNGNTHKGYWVIAGSGILTHTITNKRLVQAGYFSLSDRYESLHLCD